MKIALVRGAFLNPFECQLYAPLATRHDVILIGANWQFYPHPVVFPKITTELASLWGAAASTIDHNAPIFLNRLFSWTTGQSYGLYDLQSKSQEVDILHSAETFFTMTHQCVDITRQDHRPLIITVSENLLHMGETHPYRKRRKREAMAAAKHFITITEQAREILIQEGISKERVSVIPWSLDLQRFHPTPKDQALLSKLNIKNDQTVILFIGRFVVEKGIEDILTCIEQIKEAESRGVVFLFVGSGPLEMQIKQMQKRYPERVRLYSFAPYDQLPAIHNLADIFLLPSQPRHKIAEQFGFVLIESMACGKPIITTRVGSIGDVVGDAVKLIDPSRPDHLLAVMESLLGSPVQRQELSSKALSRAQAQFDASQNALRLESIYTQAVK